MIIEFSLVHGTLILALKLSKTKIYKKENILSKFHFYLITERLILASDLIRLGDTITFSDTLSEKNVLKFTYKEFRENFHHRPTE